MMMNEASIRRPQVPAWRPPKPDAALRTGRILRAEYDNLPIALGYGNFPTSVSPDNLPIPLVTVRQPRRLCMELDSTPPTPAELHSAPRTSARRDAAAWSASELDTEWFTAAPRTSTRRDAATRAAPELDTQWFTASDAPEPVDDFEQPAFQVVPRVRVRLARAVFGLAFASVLGLLGFELYVLLELTPR
jgi:hypothetical protein